MKSYVDLKTKKIYGCKKNSFNYLHEQGHLKFNENYPMLEENILSCWIIFTSLGLLIKLSAYISIILAFLYIGINIYEENYANKYANKLIKRER
jgi:hypothetical protein